jgi:hypothetical protein
MMKKVADQHNLPLTYSSPHLCTDNAAMIAWMGWELLNAQQNVDISGSTINALKSIPLGSYVEGLINQKSLHLLPGLNKVTTNRAFAMRMTKQRN